MFIILFLLFYVILSLFIGIVGGFGNWDFSLLRDLFVFWSKPISESGAMWKTIILAFSIIMAFCFSIEDGPFNFHNENYIPPKINPDEFNVSSTGQIIEKEKDINILI